MLRVDLWAEGEGGGGHPVAWQSFQPLALLGMYAFWHVAVCGILLPSYSFPMYSLIHSLPPSQWHNAINSASSIVSHLAMSAPLLLRTSSSSELHSSPHTSNLHFALLVRLLVSCLCTPYTHPFLHIISHIFSQYASKTAQSRATEPRLLGEDTPPC